MMNSKMKWMSVLGLACAATLFIGGCEEKSPAEKAAGDMKNATKDAANKANDAANKAAEAAKDAAKDVPNSGH